MDIREALFSLAMMCVSVLAAYCMFRRNPRETLVARGPLFIVCFLVFFYIGLTELPLAFPGLFERLLGHSVWANYMPPPKMNVTQEGGTWWVVRWLDPIRTAYFYVVIGGMAWAMVNLVRGRAWRWNAVCLVIGAILWAAHIYSSVVCFPFCF